MKSRINIKYKDQARLGLISNQRGVALIVGIIFLIVLTLFVLGGLRDVLLQERMSGAYRNQSLALSASESLVRDAQSRIFSNVLNNAGATTSTDYRALDVEGVNVPDATVRSFRSGAGYITGGLAPVNSFVPADPTSQLSQPGAYVIEGPIPVSADAGLVAGGGLGGGVGNLESHTTIGGSSSGSGGGSGGGNNSGDAERLYAYRITARATGGSDDFVRAVEATYLIVR
jgi:type IV pilus assembly protein PilX